MKSYVPHTENERREMLESIGVKSIDDFFRRSRFAIA